ncbi:MAG: hypothetical protein JO023_02015 [Chloroflexi bacterium]|nr:hypothetical protein [Chloroflexota bacterium]
MIWLLLIPLALCALLVFMVTVPLIWLAFHMLHFIAPLLLIWGAFMLMRGSSRRRRWAGRYAPPSDWNAGTQRRPRADPPAPPAGWDQPVSPSTQLAREAGQTPADWEKLPPDVRAKVQLIQQKADALAQYESAFPPFSHDLYVVRRTTAEYLPRTIDAYLAVPQRHEDLLPTPSPTPLEELKSQLQLLEAKLDEIAQDLQRKDMDGLLANRNFLEDRFGRRPSTEQEPWPASERDERAG